jgi:short-subunit dehydrogenase
MYSATKVYCDFLTEGLNYELKEFGVDVLGIRSFGLI